MNQLYKGDSELSYTQYYKGINNPILKINKNSKIFTIIKLAGVLLSGIILLISILIESVAGLVIFLLFTLGEYIFLSIKLWEIGSNFEELAKLYPSISKTAKDAGQQLRFSILAFVFSSLSGGLAGIAAIVLRLMAYYNITETFRILKENGKYPKQESKLLFFSYLMAQVTGILMTVGIIIILPLILAIVNNAYTEPLLPGLISIFIIGSIIMIVCYILETIGIWKLGQNVLLINMPAVQIGDTVRYRTYAHANQPYQKVYPNYTGPPNIQNINFEPIESRATTANINPLNSNISAANTSFIYCYNCGKKISSSSKFCEYCGAKIDD